MVLMLETADKTKFVVILFIEMVILTFIFGIATVWNSLRETPLTAIIVAISVLFIASFLSQKGVTFLEVLIVIGVVLAGGYVLLNFVAYPSSQTQVAQSQSYSNSIPIPTEKARVVQTNTNSVSLSSPSLDSAALEKRIHALINQQRNSNGLSSLSFDPSLAAIARGHSQDMAKNNYFSHVNLQGLSPSDRGNQQGYTCRKDYGSYYTYGIAENIFETSHWTTYNGIRVNDFEPLEDIAQKTITGWMNSEGHRKNILTSTYDRQGIGVGIASDDTVYITENFC